MSYGLNLKNFATIPYNRLLPFPPVATQDICLYWFLKVISSHNQLPSILLCTFIKSPQVLNFFHCKGKVGIRNVIAKREFSPETNNGDVRTRTSIYIYIYIAAFFLV